MNHSATSGFITALWPSGIFPFTEVVIWFFVYVVDDFSADFQSTTNSSYAFVIDFPDAGSGFVFSQTMISTISSA